MTNAGSREDGWDHFDVNIVLGLREEPSEAAAVWAASSKRRVEV
jgi:hypothetical protein